METHHISAERLTLARVGEILNKKMRLALSDDARRRITECRDYLDRKMAECKEPIYGITTGFGSLCNISIGHDDLSQLQKNLVMSHSCGVGERVPADIVRLMRAPYQFLQCRRAARGLPARLARRIRRPRSIGQHVAAPPRTRAGGLQRLSAPGRRSP